MITLSESQSNALREAHSVCKLIKFQLSSTWFYFTTSDQEVTYAGNTYLPGIVLDVDDIEITSEPRTNTINVTCTTQQNSIVGLVLGGNWMNKSFTIYKHFYNSAGEIFTKIAFEGLLSEYEYEPEDHEISFSVESIWADFEKTIGIKTNPVSYNRFFNATGFRHASNAINKIFWGREAPSESGQVGGGTGGRDPEGPPTEIN